MPSHTLLFPLTSECDLGVCHRQVKGRDRRAPIVPMEKLGPGSSASPRATRRPGGRARTRTLRSSSRCCVLPGVPCCPGSGPARPLPSAERLLPGSKVKGNPLSWADRRRI